MKPWHPVVAVLGLLVLYVLSQGPVVRFDYLNNTGPSQTERVFYAPIHWVTDHSKTANAAMWWYLNQWMPEDMPPGVPPVTISIPN